MMAMGERQVSVIAQCRPYKRRELREKWERPLSIKEDMLYDLGKVT